MKTPNKVYVKKEKDNVTFSLSVQYNNGGEEYIRKSTLLEWLEQNRNQSQMWFDRYKDKEDLSAKQVWEEVIDKLNEM